MPEEKKNNWPKKEKRAEKTKINYLQQFLDAGLQPTQNYDLKRKTQQQIDRLLREFALNKLTAAHPRRLGKDASPEDLAQDTHMAKLFAFGCQDILRSYGFDKQETEKQSKKYRKGPQIKRQAATINFEEYIYTKIAYLRHEMREIATNTIDTPNEQQGKKLVNNLNNELFQQVQRYEKVTNTKISLEKVPEN